MGIFALLALAIAAAAPAPAGIDWGNAPQVEIRIASNGYYPDELRLKAGEPVVLRIRNLTRDTHIFSARQFFEAAALRREDSGVVAGGAIDIEGEETRVIGLVPSAGTYTLSCTQPYHEVLGEKARIVVD